jgi:hypothetical protein
MARPPAIDMDTTVRVVLNVRSLNLTDDQFLRLCSDNRIYCQRCAARVATGSIRQLRDDLSAGRETGTDR